MDIAPTKKKKQIEKVAKLLGLDSVEIYFTPDKRKEGFDQLIDGTIYEV